MARPEERPRTTTRRKARKRDFHPRTNYTSATYLYVCAAFSSHDVGSPVDPRNDTKSYLRVGIWRPAHDAAGNAAHSPHPYTRSGWFMQPSARDPTHLGDDSSSYAIVTTRNEPCPTVVPAPIYALARAPKHPETTVQRASLTTLPGPGHPPWDDDVCRSQRPSRGHGEVVAAERYSFLLIDRRTRSLTTGMLHDQGHRGRGRRRLPARHTGPAGPSDHHQEERQQDRSRSSTRSPRCR